jgi:hypothetical protein
MKKRFFVIYSLLKFVFLLMELLFLFFFLNCNMVAPLVAVEEAKQVATCCGIDDLINPWKPEGVLGVVLVEVGVVDADPPFVGVLLANEDGVGEPPKMEDFSDEAHHE